MSQGRQKGRRVVSRREYALYLGTKAAKTSLIAIALTGIMISVFAISAVWVKGNIDPESNWELVSLLLFLLAGKSIYKVGGFAYRVFLQVQAMEPVTPWTRHNTGNLPEDATLVRASKEPPALYDDILLRAAQRGQETPAAQLLRPMHE